MSIKQLSISAFAFAAFLTGASDAGAAALTGTIRDFCAPGIGGTCTQNPDFEGTIGGLQKGQVSPILGAIDNEPFFFGVPKPGFTSAANFKQWYNDVPGVNQSAPFSLPLTETALGSGIFTYSSSSFFPIDDQLFGNQGRSHNYHFTLELFGQMTYQPGDVFTFTGDDDLWVYVDGRLLMDLGGVHPAVTESFDSTDLDAVGLSPNTLYDLAIFFAERHTTKSNFNITTAFQITPPGAVSEPLTLTMLGLGLGALGLARRRVA